MSTQNFIYSPVGDPYEHQLRLFEQRREQRSWAHFWEMGTGKSWMICHEMAWAFLLGEIDVAIILAKKGEYANWAQFLIPDLLPPNIQREVVLFNSTMYSGGKLREALTSLCTPKPGVLRIIVVNVESMAFRAPEVLKALYASAQKGVFEAIDEATCVKEVSSKRSKETYIWSAKSRIKRIMTGTPVTQSPMDLWGMSMVLGKHTLGFSSFYSFRNHFEIREPLYLGPQRTIMQTKGYKNLDQLNRILGSFSDQVFKEDCLDLPAKVYKKHTVEMTPAQQKLYNQMRDEAMLEIEGHEVEVTTVLAQIVKLHQISCGQLKVGDNEYVSIENNRIEALETILEDFNGKAIIWANYRQTLADVVASLRKKFGHDAVVDYYGGTSAADRDYAYRAFQDPDSPVRFFVANAQSAGYGLTLTQASLVVYYSNGYNLEHRLQSEDRAHRIGQTKSVTYIDLVTPDTVDERIIEVLRNKKNLAHEVLGSQIRDWI